MTLKYPKKTSTAVQKRNDKHVNTSTPSMTPYTDSSSWTAAPQSMTTGYQMPAQHQDYSQYTTDPYSTSDYHYGYTTRPLTNKSPLLSSPPPAPLLNTSTQQQIETCDWSAVTTNHETAAKPVVAPLTTYTSDKNNNGHMTTTSHWPTEFTYLDGGKATQQPQQLCSPNNGGPLHQQQPAEMIPEFINFDYEHQTGFPPSISSTASTLSSPTTSSDYNFNYQFDTLNSSMSNDAFDQQAPQMMETYGTATGYEAHMDSGIYAGAETAYATSSEWMSPEMTYEPNYYPFANYTEKMMIF